LDFSASALLLIAATEVRDRFWMKRCGPSYRRVRRISGSKNFRSLSQKDFFNTICQQRTHAPQQRPALFDHFVDDRVYPWRYPDALAPKHTREASGRSGNPSRQVRMFRDVFLIAELLDSKAESDDVGLERSWLGCPVRSSGLSGLLKSSKKPPLIHQTEARLIRRYSGYLGRGRTHAAKAH
jgi:hypothetical protein